ncbi:MAG TPA: hypothetical protein VKU41_03505 [Polyangiaceae bacterium]|nr:hypothetical protein [Polyangiaceae bacterium]
MNTLGIRAMLLASTLGLVGVVAATGCSQVEGSRCNPALSHDECDNAPAVQCVQPAAPACNGEAYCCAVDSNGNITSTESNCQFLTRCQMASANEDAGASSGSGGGGTPEASVTDASPGN